MIGSIMDSKLATLKEIQTFYGMGDIYDLYEILTVTNYNNRLLS